jgi:transcriptional regulator with XRE-family HTH domain
MAARVTCRCGWSKTYPSLGKAEFNARRHVCTAGQKTKARRATRYRRCARCGLEATYDDATVAEARHWFSKHSCRKVEDAMVRAAQRDAREALIDRTPKPCLHKVAEHEHGTYAAYVLDRCRCLPCARANSDYEANRTRQIAYGRWNQRIPAGPVREHVRSLMDAGIGLKRIVKISGVSQGSLWKLMYGKRQADGTQQPSRRILRETAEKLYAIDPDWTGDELPLADGARVPADVCVGVTRRIQALVALGWSQSKLAAQLGIQRSNFRLTEYQWSLRWQTVKAVRALYEELSMTLPPEDDWRQRIAASRARNYAAARGWAPPLAWDDDQIDDPTASPNPTGADIDLEEVS